MRFLFAGILLITASCGPKPTFVTKQGFNVRCLDAACFDVLEVESVIDMTASTLISKIGGPYSSDSVAKIYDKYWGWISIIFVPERVGPAGSCATEKDPTRACRGFPCPVSSNGWCVGLFDSNSLSITVAKRSDCVADSSLTHELVHYFNYFLENYHDYRHDRRKYFAAGCLELESKDNRRACFSNSVERTAKWNSFCNICGGCDEKKDR